MLIELAQEAFRRLSIEIAAMREEWLTAVILQKLTDGERQDLQRGLALVEQIVDTP